MSCAGMRLRLGREHLEGIYKKVKIRRGSQLWFPLLIFTVYVYFLALVCLLAVDAAI